MKILERSQYIESFESRLHPRGRLSKAQIILTRHCNLNCQHCFIDDKNNRNQLDLPQLKVVIDQLYRVGILHLDFSGGEPLIRNDFPDIYSYARQKGFLISIFTNGTLITRKIADFLAEAPPFAIEITLNGLTSAVYEKVTGVAGSFTKAIRAIHLLKRRHLPLVLKCNAMTINRSQVLQIKQFAQRLLGQAYFTCDLVLSAGMNGLKRPVALRLTGEEILKIKAADTQMQEDLQWDSGGWQQPRWLKQNYLFPCDLATCYIDQVGLLRLCPWLKDQFVDLKKEELLSGFHRLYRRLRSLKLARNHPCYGCPIRHLCRQCPGRAFLEYGNLDTRVQYFCQLAHQEQQWAQRILAQEKV